MQQNPIDALKSGGKKEGLEIWALRTVKQARRSFPHVFTTSQPKPEPEYEVFSVPPAKQGIFYNEDLYIVLKTSADTNQKTVHFWFGEAYDETPPPWIDTFEDLELDWKASQHFEFQGHECELFESYFDRIQPAIRYKRGKHPDPYAEKARGDTRFYKLERLDKAHFRVKEIPFNIALMTKEACFILDTDYNTRSYMSNKTDVAERKKSIIVANRIREQDHEGGGEVEVVDLNHFSSSADREALIKTAKLLEEQEESFPEIDYDAPDDDPASPHVKLNMVTLIGSDDVDTCYPPRFKYIPRPRKGPKKEDKKSFFGRAKKRVSTSFRRMLGFEVKNVVEFEIPALEDKFVKQLMSKPFKYDQLNSRKCYVLEGTPGQSVMVWVGKSSNKICKQELFECMRLEIRRCDQFNETYDNEVEVTDTDVYTKNTDKNAEKKTPQWTHIVKVNEGNEIVKFKKYFPNWI